MDLVVNDGTTTQRFPMTIDQTATSTLKNGIFQDKEQYIYKDIAQKGKYQYHFEASDGPTTLRLPNTGELNFEVINTPVVIVPGILGSYLNRNNELKTQIWPNMAKMLIEPFDNYLDELIVNTDGLSSLPLLLPTDIFRKISLINIDFFDELIKQLINNNYQENTDLFVFPYDWRLDNTDNANLLNDKINEILQQTGVKKVDIVAHSMGGLVVKQYIKNINGEFVRKFIDIATPHLGSPKAFKILSYGDNLDIAILNQDRIKTITQNMPSIYQLLPSREYFNSTDPNYSYYFHDSDDIDNNGIKGKLNYDQTMEFLKNGGRNYYLLGFNDILHNNLDNWNGQDYGVKTTNIVGCGEPTIGKIFALNKEVTGYEYALSYISGDQTVPLRSAESIDSDKIYYASNISHSTMPSANGVRQLVASILTDTNFNSIQYQNIKEDKSNCSFSGKAISFHSPVEMHIYDEQGNHTGPTETGGIENNIEEVTYDIIEGNKFVFLPNGKRYTIKAKATDTGSFNVRIKTIENEEVTQTQYFNQMLLMTIKTNAEIDIKTNQTNFTIKIDQDGDSIFEQDIQPSSILDETQSQDITKPETQIAVDDKEGNNGWYLSDAKVSLNATDDNSGILKTEYSLNNGATWSIYSNSFILSNEGETIIKYRSIDKAGNIEKEKQIIIKIDKTAPEAKIYFDKENQDLKVEGIDDLTENPIISIFEIDEDKRGVVYKIEDEAGNITELTFKKEKQKKKEIEAELESVRYNNILREFPDNKIKYEWSLEKDGGIIIKLEQEIEVKDSFKIEAKYEDGVTEIEIKEKHKKEEEFKINGTVILYLEMKNGDILYKY